MKFHFKSLVFAELQALLVVLQELNRVIESMRDRYETDQRIGIPWSERDTNDQHAHTFGLCTDSKYVIDCLMQHMPRWKNRAEKTNDEIWRNGFGVPVPQQEILEDIEMALKVNFGEYSHSNLTFFQCRRQGSTCYFNRLVDKLANEGANDG